MKDHVVLVSRAQLDQLDNLEPLVMMGEMASMVLLGKTEPQLLPELLNVLLHNAQPVHQLFLGHLALQEAEDQEDHQVTQDLLHLEPFPVPQVLLDQEDLLAFLDNLDRRDLPDVMVSLALVLGLLEPLVVPVLLGQKVFLDPLVEMAPMHLPDLLDQLGTPANQDHLATQVFLVPKDPTEIVEDPELATTVHHLELPLDIKLCPEPLWAYGVGSFLAK